MGDLPYEDVRLGERIGNTEMARELGSRDKLLLQLLWAPFRGSRCPNVQAGTHLATNGA